MIRIGSGFDAHRLAGGRPLVLGGVTFDYPKGLDGHSDADVVTHAVCDAALGAAGLGDIGGLFPDTDDEFKNISSLVLLERVRERVAEAGWRVVNVDVTALCEAPKIAPRADTMRANLARALGVDADRISVKATTTEGLGFTGRGEGIAAWAVALLERT